jgi:hypothetical protein
VSFWLNSIGLLVPREAPRIITNKNIASFIPNWFPQKLYRDWNFHPTLYRLYL